MANPITGPRIKPRSPTLIAVIPRFIPGPSFRFKPGMRSGLERVIPRVILTAGVVSYNITSPSVLPDRPSRTSSVTCVNKSSTPNELNTIGNSRVCTRSSLGSLIAMGSDSRQGAGIQPRAESGCPPSQPSPSPSKLG